jgi:murein DD-endopeptidase MepM/ murein hydrolase activator NlpD
MRIDPWRGARGVFGWRRNRGLFMQDLPQRAGMVARAMAGQRDLYAVLRAGAAGLQAAGVAPFLDHLHRAVAGTETAPRLAGVDQAFLRAVIRAGAGLPPVPGAEALRAKLQNLTPHPLFDPDIAASPHMALPTAGQRPDMPAFSDRAFDPWFASRGARYGLGLYGETRSVYTAAQFADSMSDERRKVHLGVDVFAAAGTPVHAPLDAEVISLSYNADPLDYGHTLFLRHDGFVTLYGHLGASLPGLLRVGQQVRAGQVVAHLGDWPENGGWAPHLHFQVISDLMDQTAGNFWGVGHHSLWDVWQAISPDPNLLLRLPATAFAL